MMNLTFLRVVWRTVVQTNQSFLTVRSPGMIQPYRPTSVERWSRCPTLWYLSEVEGWQKVGGEWTSHMLIGSTIHAWIAGYWRRILDGPDAPDPEMNALDFLCEGWPLDQPGLDAAKEHVRKVAEAVMKWISKGMPDAIPLIVEQSLGADGHTTPDLVTREPGGIVITDWKYSAHVAPENIHYRLDGADRSHQFAHYAWAVNEYLKEYVKESVRLIRKVVIVGGPRIIVKAVEVMVDEHAQAEWLRQAKVKWQEMGDMTRMPELVYRREEGCKPFGDKYPCEMYDACWTG